MTFDNLRARIITSLLLLLCASASQAQAAPQQGQGQTGQLTQTDQSKDDIIPYGEPQPDSGSVSDNIYSSDFFRFTYQFPRGWNVEDDPTRKYIRKLGEAMISGGDARKQAILEAAERRTYTLLMVSEHPSGYPAGFIPSIIVAAENISVAPQIQKGSDYQLHLKVEMKEAVSGLKILREPADIIYAGADFSRMDVVYQRNSEVAVYQSYLATIRDSYALLFIFTSDKQAGLDGLVETLDSLHFGPKKSTPTSGQSHWRGMVPTVSILTLTGGVDFSAYLNRFLAATKRNWFAVMPETAMLGEKGIVGLTLEIKKDGSIVNGPTLERSSGKGPLDEAALTAVRTSSPFEPLPAEFKGPSIKVRMIFFYNLPVDTNPN